MDGWSTTPSFPPGPPRILGPPQAQAIIDGNSVTYRCEVFASPDHETSWSFTDSEGVTTEIVSTETSDTSKYTVGRDRDIRETFGQLTVLDVQYSDRGAYTCTAESSLGARTANATLTVHGRLYLHV